jgi:sialic acid synthase SpsE
MIVFGPRRIGAGFPCLLIAELGTSHQGDLDRGRRLIDAAVKAGADCVKFQLVRAGEILHPRSGIVPLPTGNVALYDHFKAMERETGFYEALKRHAEDKGALFLCSPFGIGSARELRALGAQALKIASPELNHLPLLREAVSFGLPLFLSTGVSTLGDIERAMTIVGRGSTVLLHCITSYPAPEEQYNVAVVKTLRAAFGVETGLSDHSLDPVLVPVAAVACGACALEKHFCLSRDDAGLDDPIALEPAAFADLVRAVRDAEACGPRAALERLGSRYGEERVATVLGSGVKELAPAEAANYGRTNRSVHAVREIAAGSIIGEGDAAILRTEKTLRPGLEPRFMEQVVGACAQRLIPEGEGIEWADIICRRPGT